MDGIAARVAERINFIIDKLLKQATFLFVLNDGTWNGDGLDVCLAAVDIQRQRLKRRKRKPGQDRDARKLHVGIKSFTEDVIFNDVSALVSGFLL